jgi:probable phosphoglycerate mutase
MLVAYIDGGSRGNPGPAAYGVRVEDADGNLVEELRRSIGVATNNVAEYEGLLAALRWALARGERRLHVRSDSELLIRQMRGEYRVKHPGLQPLHAQARLLTSRFDRVRFEHVRREMNVHADRLANEAMDEAGAAPRAGSRAAASRRNPTATGSGLAPATAPTPPDTTGARGLLQRGGERDLALADDRRRRLHQLDEREARRATLDLLARHTPAEPAATAEPDRDPRTSLPSGGDEHVEQQRVFQRYRHPRRPPGRNP